MLNETEVVWRICERTDESEFVAYTCLVLSPGGQRTEQYRIRVRWLDEEGAVIGSCFGFGDPKLRFWAATSSGTEYDYDQQKPVYSLCATGSAFDSAVTMVVGMTNTGRRVESRVVDGFWALHIEPAEYSESWVSLTATRANRSVVHRYELRTAPSFRLPTDDVDPLAELPIISDESIPEPIRGFAQGHADTRGDHPTIVWRAYAQEGDYVYVAFTLDGPYTTGRGHLAVAAFDAASEFDLPLTAHASGTLMTSFAFTPVGWGHSSGTRRGQPVGTLRTGGLVLDDRVTKIIGVTEQGRTVECTPFESFWVLWCTYNKENPDPRVIEDRWVSIRAVDENGEVLHGLEKGQIPKF